MESNTTDLMCNTPDTVLNLTDPEKADGFLYSSTSKLIITVIIPIISIVGVAGNGAFLYMSARLPELRNAIVTSYLANLAVCDICFLFFINGWYIVALISNPWFYALPVNSTFGCASYVISTHFWYLTSLGLITLISTERYLAICKPLVHRRIAGKARTLKLIVGTWVSALIISLSFIPQNGYFTTYCLLWPETEAFKDLPQVVNMCKPVSKSADIYVSLFIIISFALILIVNTVLFVKITMSLWSLSSNNSETDRIRYQVTRTLVVNGIIFFLCQVPYRVYALDDVLDNLGMSVDILSEQAESSVVLIGLTFLYLNSIINPYLYVLTCQHYRRAMTKVFCGCMGIGALKKQKGPSVTTEV